MSRRNFSGARTRACRVHTLVNASKLSGPCRMSARPGIFFRFSHQPSLNRIPLNVPCNPIPFLFIPHPVIVRLSPPKRLASPSQDCVRASRSGPLQSFKQVAGGNLRKQKHVDMVRHNREWSKLIVTDRGSFEKRIDHDLCNILTLEKRRPATRFIQVAVHPNESFTSRALRGGCEPRAWQASVQVPRHEQPAAVRINVRKPSLHHHSYMGGISPEKFSVGRSARTRACRVRTPANTFKNSRRSQECERCTQSACATS